MVYVLLCTIAGIYNPRHKPEEELPAWVESEKEEFRRVLDANKDGKLDTMEIKKWLTSDEDEFYSEEADHLMESADQDQVSINMYCLLLTTSIFIIRHV